jgi:putative serine protease PepD
VIGGAGAYAVLDGGQPERVEPLPQAPFDDSPPSQGSVAAVAERVLPVVVTVDAAGGGNGGSGSGFVLDTAGYILTNYHVIAVAAQGGSIIVGLADGGEEPARLVGRSTSYDLAVLQIDRQDLQAAALGNSDNVRVGDTAIAIGAPLGLSETVTQGIVSALDRPVTAGGVGETAFISAIQTDAAINPGNSGGPLLNGSGEVIGVNSAIATLAGRAGEGGSIGLGFSIPINQAVRIADEIIATGTSTTPVLGVTLDLSHRGDGARIGDVAPGGPSDDAGLRPGDIIVAVDGSDVANGNELVIALRTNAPGDTVELTLADGTSVRVVLAAQEED